MNNKKKVKPPLRGASQSVVQPQQDCVSFIDAYASLSRVAKTLEEMEEPDLDRIVPLMSEAAKAYDVCKKRMDAVETILKERGWLNGEPEGK